MIKSPDILINRIEIINTSWGIHDINEITKSHIIILNNGQIKVSFYNNICKRPVIKDVYTISKEAIETFINKLINEIDILNWKDDYSIDVCDGCFWTVTITMTNGMIKQSKGTIEKPPKGDNLKDMILKLVKYKNEPWLI